METRELYEYYTFLHMLSEQVDVTVEQSGSTPFRRICHPSEMNIRICDPQKFFIINIRYSMLLSFYALYIFCYSSLFADSISAIINIGMTYHDERK